jgi:hypothetical protein
MFIESSDKHPYIKISFNKNNINNNDKCNFIIDDFALNAINTSFEKELDEFINLITKKCFEYDTNEKKYNVKIIINIIKKILTCISSNVKNKKFTTIYNALSLSKTLLLDKEIKTMQFGTIHDFIKYIMTNKQYLNKFEKIQDVLFSNLNNNNLNHEYTCINVVINNNNLSKKCKITNINFKQKIITISINNEIKNVNFNRICVK